LVGLDLGSIGPAIGKLGVIGLAVSGVVILVVACPGIALIRTIFAAADPDGAERPGLPEAPPGRLRSALRERQNRAAGQTAAGCGITQPGRIAASYPHLHRGHLASGRLSADKANAPGGVGPCGRRRSPLLMAGR
jgi:hypothetical protein